MTEDEKLKSIPGIKEKGNALFKEKNYDEACDIYAKGIGILEQLMLALVFNVYVFVRCLTYYIYVIYSEKPNDEEWIALNRMKIPLLLNYSQCKLIQKDYYAVIEHCTTVLKHDPGSSLYVSDLIYMYKRIIRHRVYHY